MTNSENRKPNWKPAWQQTGRIIAATYAAFITAIFSVEASMMDRWKEVAVSNFAETPFSPDWTLEQNITCQQVLGTICLFLLVNFALRGVIELIGHLIFKIPISKGITLTRTIATRLVRQITGFF